VKDEKFFPLSPPFCSDRGHGGQVFGDIVDTFWPAVEGPDVDGCDHLGSEDDNEDAIVCSWPERDSFAAADRDGAPMTDAEWAKAEIVNPHKVAVGLKLDDDLLGWFKSQGKGYQTRINTILRRYYETHRKAS
jgi:uncharacterized protein (DUF4415 family)